MVGLFYPLAVGTVVESPQLMSQFISNCVFVSVGSASRPRQSESKVDVIMAGDARAWNTTINRLLARALAKDERLRFRGFGPKYIYRRSELESSIEFLGDDNFQGHFPSELLNFPRASANMDYLIMHSFTPELGEQAEKICKTKNCKWIHVVHTIWAEVEKLFDATGITNARRVEEQHQWQIELCEKADIVVTIGPKIAEAHRSLLHSSGKDTNVICLTPAIFPELHQNGKSVHNIHENRDKFCVLIDAADSAGFFNAKGLDIAMEAISSLQDMSYHLVFVPRPGGDSTDLEIILQARGLDWNQFTMKSCVGTTAHWAECIVDADVVIMPSRFEGFGLSGLYAISANVPVLVGRNSGLAMALKMLPSGANHVVESNNPRVWADKIKAVRAKDPTIRAEQAKRLRKEYMYQFNWENQCKELVEKMITKHCKCCVSF